MSVRVQRRFPLALFAKATITHVGATAIATALRDELTRHDYVSDDEFNSAYSAARLTPGTTMLALYVALGHRLAGWRGSILALVAGLFLPAALVVALSLLYSRFHTVRIARQAIEGANVAVIAILIGSSINLVRPLIQRHGLRAAVLAIGVLLIAASTSLPAFATIVLAAIAGSWLLR